MMNTKSTFCILASVVMLSAVALSSLIATFANSAYADGFKNQGQCNKFINKDVGTAVGIHGPFINEIRKEACRSNTN
jgi:hypothetical protein